MKLRSRGAALIEFALAWPVALLLVLGAVELALWASESFAVRAAALAGARAATVAGAGPDVAAEVALRALRPAVFGTAVTAGCDVAPPPAGITVCARDIGPQIEVDVDGSVPALVPLAPGGGLPVSAHVVMRKELYTA